MGVYAVVIGLAFLSVVSTTAGIALALRFHRSRNGIAFGIGFSAGLMLFISFLDLVPVAAASVGVWTAWGAVMVGAGVLSFLNFLIPHTHLIDEDSGFRGRTLRSAYLVLFGLVLHDVPEGFAMANSYVASPSLGVAVAVAIALHNIPEEFAMAMPAVLAGRKSVIFRMAVLSVLAEPAGAAMGLVAVGMFPALNPVFMAFAAGAMIFVSIHELLPMARAFGNILLFGVGAVFSGLVYLGLRAVL